MEARSKPFPVASSNWGLSAAMPIKNAGDMLYLEVLDATSLGGRSDGHYGRELNFVS